MFEEKRISAIILAGGSGRRMADSTPKQYLEICGKPILNYSIDAFESAESISEIILVVPHGQVEYCRQMIVEPWNYSKVTRIIEGGTTRQESSLKGILVTSQGSSFVMIHDGARPFVQSQEIENMVKEMTGKSAVIIAVQVKDTIKRVSENAVIEETLERSNLWAAMTPQAFKRDLIIKAHEKAVESGHQATDDASLVEIMGEKVHIMEGNYMNMKITTKEDLVIGEAILADRRRLD